MKFLLKNIENWRSWKMSFFLVDHFEFFSKMCLFFSNKNNLGFHMRKHGWFLQNLGKDFIRTNMQTTVVLATSVDL